MCIGTDLLSFQLNTLLCLYMCILPDTVFLGWSVKSKLCVCYRQKEEYGPYHPPYQKATQLEQSVIPRVIFNAQFIFVIKRSADVLPIFMLAAATHTCVEGVLR